MKFLKQLRRKLMRMSKIKRNQKISLFRDGINRYAVADKNGNPLYKHSDDYFIYFKNVNFKEAGIIDGRFLGDATENIIDEECKSVGYNNKDGFTVDGKTIKTARLVAVHNKKKTLVIIEN